MPQAAAAAAAGPPPRFVLQWQTAEGQGIMGVPLGMSEEGLIVGWAGPDGPLAWPLVVSRDGQHRLLVTADSTGFAFGAVSPELVVGSADRQPYVWVDGAPTLLGVPAGFFSGTAFAVSRAGLIVGSWGESDHDGHGPRPCAWESVAGPPVTLASVIRGSASGTALAVNSRGQIAGLSGGFEGTFYAARWDGVDAEPIRIDPLPGGSNSEARGINDAGDVVGRTGYPDFSVEAFLWRADTGAAEGLGFLSRRRYSEAFDVNDRRQVVGTSAVGGGLVHAFLWQEGVMHDLNDLLVLRDPRLRYLRSAVAINEAGEIAVEVVVDEGTGETVQVGRLRPLGARPYLHLTSSSSDCGQDATDASRCPIAELDLWVLRDRGATARFGRASGATLYAGAGEVRGRLPRAVYQQLASSAQRARVSGAEGECSLPADFAGAPGATARQRLTWYGPDGRRNVLELGTDYPLPCSRELTALARRLLELPSRLGD